MLDSYRDATHSMQILLSGVLVLLTVSAAALLHTNEPEFILGRFPGVSQFEYSLFDSILYLAYLIFGVILGILSDRIAKRKIFIVIGGFGGSLFYWLMTTTLDYEILLIMRFVQGMFTVLAWQSLMTSILDFSTSSNRGKNMGVFGVFLATAMGVGPVIGGIVARYGVFQPYYVASFFSLVVGLVALCGIRDSNHLKARVSFRKSITLAKRCPKIKIPSILNFVDRLHMGFILTALPLLLVTVLGLSESFRGMILGLFATPFILLQYPIGRLSDSIGRRILVITGSFCYAFTLAFVGFAAQVGLIPLIISLVLLGTFSGLTAPPTMAWIGDCVPPKDRATGTGLFNLLGNFGMVLGPIVLGVILLQSNFVIAFVVAGSIELLSLIVVIIKS
ncbi:MAG: MFS transporter [Candidatus Thorarchaeota archaeon]|nr:MFS transporter [Candidatus Thorarchaeota archaeon]